MLHKTEAFRLSLYVTNELGVIVCLAKPQRFKQGRLADVVFASDEIDALQRFDGQSGKAAIVCRRKGLVHCQPPMGDVCGLIVLAPY